MEALDRIIEYFADRQDASCEPGEDRFSGNKEMALLQDAEAVAAFISDSIQSQRTIAELAAQHLKDLATVCDERDAAVANYHHERDNNLCIDCDGIEKDIASPFNACQLRHRCAGAIELIKCERDRALMDAEAHFQPQIDQGIRENNALTAYAVKFARFIVEQNEGTMGVQTGPDAEECCLECEATWPLGGPSLHRTSCIVGEAVAALSKNTVTVPETVATQSTMTVCGTTIAMDALRYTNPAPDAAPPMAPHSITMTVSAGYGRGGDGQLETPALRERAAEPTTCVNGVSSQSCKCPPGQCLSGPRLEPGCHYPKGRGGTSLDSGNSQSSQSDIKAMVDRFIAWKLPADFCPDAGITFTPPKHPNSWPTGTNLLTADQARAMFEHVCRAAS